MRKYVIAAFVIVVFTVFCRVFPAAAKSDAPILLHISTGQATRYSAKLAGRKTASGQRYDPKLLTAAHRTLPLGAVVRVTNLRNGREVVVRINDRGPFGKGKIIDLSYEGASRLNMIRQGVAKVQVEVVGDRRGRPYEPGTGFYLCYGEGGSGADTSVEKMRRKLGSKVCRTLPSLRLVAERRPSGSSRTHVAMGPFRTFQDAEAAFAKVRREHPQATIRCFPLDGTALKAR